MNIIAFLYHYNDIDHITPVLWKLLTEGHKVSAIMLDPDYQVDQDPRIKLLCEHSNFSLGYIHKVLPPRWLSGLFFINRKDLRGRIFKNLRALLRVSGISIQWAINRLEQMSAQVCIFEWGSGKSRGRREFLRAAHKLGLRTVCLPHGLNVYTNPDVTPEIKKMLENPKPFRAGNNCYDAYVYQSTFHRDQDIIFGLDPKRSHVLGSARFCPEWKTINEKLYPVYKPSNAPDGRLKIVFMLPHWGYNNEKEKTCNLIKILSHQDWIYLVLKEHTRAGSSNLPDELASHIDISRNAECVSEAASVSLIRWADVVINYSSSIGLEVLLQEKALLNPSYLHTNQSIFDECNATYQAHSDDEVIQILRQIQAKNIPAIDDENLNLIFKKLTYGDRQPFRVLDAYRDIVIGSQSSSC